MKVNPKYTGSDGSYATNVDRDSGPASVHPDDEHGGQILTDADLDLPPLPELIPVQVGLDLGQVNDSSAFTIAEPEDRDGVVHHNVRRLERIPRGTPYPAIVDRTEEIMRNLGKMSTKRIAEGLPGLDPLLVIDAGGVGRSVADSLEERGLELVRVTFTGGGGLREKEDGSWTVAKGTLVGSLLMLIQDGRVHLPEGTVDSEAMIEELRAFRVDTTKSGNEVYAAKTGSHDDLLMSLALATLPGLRPKIKHSYFGIAAVRTQGW